MAYHIYALIKDGIVKDTWHTCQGVDIATKRAKAVYGDEAYAIECSYKYVIAGDTYVDSKFYHNGVEVAGEENPETRIQLLQSQINQQSSDIDDLIVMVAEG